MTLEHDANPPARRWERALAGLILAGAAMVVFHPALAGKVIGGHGPSLILRQFQVEGGKHPATAKDVELAILPFRCFTHREYAAGRVPLWNPQGAGGAPFLGNQQSAALHPFTLLGLLVPWRHALLVGSLATWALAFGGTWLLGKRLGLGDLAAAASATTFALSEVVVERVGYPVGGAWAHLPLLLALASSRSSRSLPLALCLASSVLIGHFEYLPLIWAATGIAWLASKGIRSFGALVGTLALGAGLASVLILPGAEYLRYSTNVHKRGSGASVVRGQGPEPCPEVRGRLGLVRQSGPHQRLPTAIGFVPLALVPIGLLDRRGLTLGALAAPLHVLLPDTPVSRLVWSVPPFNLTVRHRLTFPIVLAAALLCGLGIRRLQTLRQRLAPVLLVLLALWIPVERALASVSAGIWSAPDRLFPEFPDLESLAKRSGWDRVASGSPNLGLVYGYHDVEIYDAIGVLSYDREWGPTYAAVRPCDRRQATDFRRAAAGRYLVSAAVPRQTDEDATRNPDGGFAIVARQAYLTALTILAAPSEGSPGCGWDLSIERAPVGRVWQASLRARAIPREGQKIVEVVPSVWCERDERLTLAVSARAPCETAPSLASVRVTWSDAPGPAVSRVGYLTAVEDRGALGRARLTRPLSRDESVSLRSEEPTRVVVEASLRRPGRLVLADVVFPGWVATSAGKLLPIVNEGPFRAVDLPAGEQAVEFLYRPSSYRIGLFVTLVSCALLGGVRACRRHRVDPRLMP